VCKHNKLTLPVAAAAAVGAAAALLLLLLTSHSLRASRG
jgi:hypothetical protein